LVRASLTAAKGVFMALIVHAVAAEAITALGPIVNRIAARDRNLGAQLRRAATSMVLNIAEAEGSDAGNARARLHTAAGSTREARAALTIAVAWGYIAAADRDRVELLLDRTSAMLHGLLRSPR
jgi:four helix bundle protein